mmetsp:Transcript_10299/g.28415  ORF Transcript_10299/g.28415 Transcript_10299/m.28415 type:complete len:239 (-) Transcript_10299:330-1046(-)
MVIVRVVSSSAIVVVAVSVVTADKASRRGWVVIAVVAIVACSSIFRIARQLQSPPSNSIHGRPRTPRTIGSRTTRFIRIQDFIRRIKRSRSRSHRRTGPAIAVGISGSSARPQQHFFGHRILRFPSIHKTLRITINSLVQRALLRHALQGAIGTTERVMRPIVRRKGQASGTLLKGAHFVERSSKPSITEFVRRWWFFHHLGMRLIALTFVFSFVQLFAVHVRVRPHGAAFHRPIHAE